VAVLTAAEAAAWDREAEARIGVPERVLIENAARSAALVVERLFPRGRVVAAVGSGNNGADALVLLRTLAAWGRDVGYVAVGSRPPDPALAHGYPLPLLPREDLPSAFAAGDVLVDGILGTGSSGAPRGGAQEAIRALNASGRPIVAMDLPSGVDPTSGAVPGDAVSATATLTFGWPKQGLLFFPARGYCGRLIALEIGFPPLPPERRPSGELLTPGWAAANLPKRAPNAYKGAAGRVLVVAGREGMAGAALVAAHAALRAGAGYLWLASVAGNRVPLQGALPEAIFLDRADDDALRPALEGADALLIGPGIGLDEGARTLLFRLLEEGEGKPALVDADALTLLSREKGALERLASRRAIVLTPHPGEMERLTGRAIREITADPVGEAREFADRVGCVVVLKGMPSVVAAPEHPVLINTVGSSDLAKAGMGDQLAGVSAAFLAAGADARTAAGLALYYAGRAADLAGRGRALSPRDVSDHLDRALADPGAAASSLALPFVTFDQPARR
jgi:NAD(P)H-hydrate epimerase